ncbi:MAG: exo-alpha-sialidase [Asgard group archaeon]|nr:exo-alpha-sialidase [Asgard group archaeon]
MVKRKKVLIIFSHIILCLIFSLNIISINASTSIGSFTINSNPLIVSFTEDILLSTDDSIYPHHVEPTIAIGDDGTIYTGWKNAFGHNTAGVRVAFSKSKNNGRTWTAPYYMPYFAGFQTGQSDPWMVFSDGNLYYAYLEYSLTATPLTQITMAKTSDKGASWNIVSGTNGIYFADKETMTADKSGNIYIVYDDVDIGSGEVYVRITQSTDFGASFSERSIIVDSNSTPDSHVGPYVTTDSQNNVYVAWMWFSSEHWGDVHLVKSEDQGLTFSTPIDINPDGENGTSVPSIDGYASKVTLPVIRFDQNDRLYVMWAELGEEDGSWGIFLRYTDDFGENWSNRYQINQKVTGDQWQPDFDIDSQGRLHIVYYDLKSNYFRPYYRMAYFNNYQTSEIAITEAMPITQYETSSSFTRPGDYITIRVDSKDMPHIVWTDGRDDEMDIYYCHGVKESNIGLIIGSTIGIFAFTTVMVVVIVLIIRKKRI